MKTHLVIPDQHANPFYNNLRAEWLGKLMADLKPDVVVNLGDAADLTSLSSYDKGKASFHGKNYGDDIASHLDFQDRMWYNIRKSKKKLPTSYVLEGNHEHRIKRFLEFEPHLKGAVSFNDLDFKKYYNEVVEYSGEAPGIITVDGIDYAHYFTAGISGRALQSVHHAYDLTSKRFTSSTVGHSHLMDYAVRKDSSGRTRMGLVAGVFQDYVAPWAGKGVCSHWWSGVVIKRNVSDGVYDPEFVSLERLKRTYA
jgi:Calcineurin-like phosphoesterase